MSLLEGLLLALSIVTIAIVLYFNQKQIKDTFISLLWIIPLYYSISEVSQFSDIDGHKRILDVYWLPNSSMSAWDVSSMRTTIAFMSPLATLIRKIPGISEPIGLELLKCLHWFGGFAILLGIFFLLQKCLIPKLYRRSFAILYPWFVLLMPTTIVSLKIFKNDTYSMVLPVLSLFLIIAGLKLKNNIYLILSILVAYLGAQEKLNAAPFLLLSLISFGWFTWKTTKKAVNSALAVFLGFGISLLTGVASFALVYITRHGNVSGGFWFGITEPFSYWLYPIIMAITPVRGGTILPDIYNIFFLPLVSLAIILASLTILVQLEKRIVNVVSCKENCVYQLSSKVILITMSVIIITGIFGTFFVQAYWDPYAPLSPGEFHYPSSLNNAIYHFKAFSYLLHIFYSISYSSAVFLNAIPTMMLSIVLLFLTKTKNITVGENFNTKPFLILLGLAFAFPLAFGFFQIPPANKYFNIGLLLFSISSCVFTIVLLTNFQYGKIKLHLVIIIMFGTLLLEISPFQPLFGGFRPIWSVYPDAKEPRLGQVNPSWVGYGEEGMIIGKQIIHECNRGSLELEPGSKCNDLNLYIYAGDWIGGQDYLNIHRIPYPKTPILKQKTEGEIEAGYSYTRNDYYIIMRLTAIKGYGFPYGLAPDFIVEGRGFINGWSFRGDRLKSAGYLFYE